MEGARQHPEETKPGRIANGALGKPGTGAGAATGPRGGATTRKSREQPGRGRAGGDRRGPGPLGREEAASPRPARLRVLPASLGYGAFRRQLSAGPEQRSPGPLQPSSPGTARRWEPSWCPGTRRVSRRRATWAPMELQVDVSVKPVSAAGGSRAPRLRPRALHHRPGARVPRLLPPRRPGVPAPAADRVLGQHVEPRLATGCRPGWSTASRSARPAPRKGARSLRAPPRAEAAVRRWGRRTPRRGSAPRCMAA
ncbi:translation initiation factor IF-2-like [Myotis myotis]|uniref:translation initiation factor IF-2-like n=1 Tax=Myotis myotis TaxID=51298 RepID=UPI001749054E|nr:translation initiation factor IF-2-like [Myotis myotis]